MARLASSWGWLLEWPVWLRVAWLHVAFLAAIACYVCRFFPHQQGVVLAFAAAALVGEAVSLWRRILIAEGLLIATAIAIYVWWRPASHEQWHAYLGMLMATWLLVPSRIGWLRWLVPLVALEVLYLAINADSPAQVRAACAALVPIAIAALAADAWLISISGARASARSRPPRLAMLRWALLPAALAIAAGIGAGESLNRSPPVTVNKGPRPAGEPSTGVSTTPRIGEPGHVSRDPTVCARINWQGAQPPEGMVYLRAMALDHVLCPGDLVEWQADRLDELSSAPGHPPAADGQCWLYRAASSTDVILHPDGNDAIDLEGMVGDPDGNLFRVGFGEAPRVYRCGIVDEPRAAAADPDNTHLQWHDRLKLGNIPWERISAGQPWEQMKAEDAAQAIASVINQRCSYSLDLPEPAHGGGGAIRTFLFDDSPAKRVGHCQYFATAEVLLMRIAQHPSRMVVGFASDERDEQGVTFRGMHAHAWVEFIDSTGHWRRIDPTPAAGLRLIRDRETPDDPLPPVPASVPVAPPDEAKTASELPPPRTIAALVIGGGGLLAVGWLARRWWRRRGRDPRLIVLEGRADDLFAFARGLGVRVGPASTVASVSLALEHKTGIALGRWRDAHLAARYGTGPVPEEWPYAEMRAAMKRRVGV